MTERIILTDSLEQTAIIFGSFDANMAKIEKEYGVDIITRETDKTAGNAIVISGDDIEKVNLAASALQCLCRMATYSDDLTDPECRLCNRYGQRRTRGRAFRV